MAAPAICQNWYPGMPEYNLVRILWKQFLTLWQLCVGSVMRQANPLEAFGVLHVVVPARVGVYRDDLTGFECLAV